MRFPLRIAQAGERESSRATVERERERERERESSRATVERERERERERVI